MKPRRRIWLGHLWTVAEFALKNLATPIAFFWMFQFHGARPAIALSILVTFVQLVAHWIFRLKLTPFFLVASGFTVGLGTIDLLVTTPKYFRLEPFAQNFVLGGVFLLTVFTRKPIVAWFAEALPPQFKIEMSESTRDYMKKVTWAWAIYFFIKSFVFLYLAFQVDLGRLVILRTLIGGSSLVLMVGGELVYRKWLWRKKIKPSF